MNRKFEQCSGISSEEKLTRAICWEVQKVQTQAVENTSCQKYAKLSIEEMWLRKNRNGEERIGDGEE
jgi:hypothetical protein